MSNLARVFVWLFVRIVLARTHFCYTTDNVDETIHMAIGGRGISWTVYAKVNDAISIVAEQNHKMLFALSWTRGGKPEVTFCNSDGLDLLFKTQEKAEKAFSNGLDAVQHLDGFIFTKPNWAHGNICLLSSSNWKLEAFDGEEWTDDFDSMGEAIRTMDARFRNY